MAKTPALATTLAGILLLAACATPPAIPENPDIRVEYINPEKFTDVGDSAVPSDASRTGHLEQFRKHLVQRAASRLGTGQKLTVSITNIDMAGNFEPWRIRLGDTRIIRDVYPPRIDLRFTLTAADGTIIREGERQLRDLTFLMTTPHYYRDDPLRYEKALLDDWLERELPERRN